MDDLVEDDENNDAIEALFGAGGSALISDDLVRDIMKDEDPSSAFVEPEDRDQIDGEASVDGGKLTDLLGPGFILENLNLVNVADIMKNLKEDAPDESAHPSPPTPLETSLNNTVSRGGALGRTISTPTSSQTSAGTILQSSQVAAPTVSVPAVSTAPYDTTSKPNQPLMAPLGASIPGLQPTRDYNMSAFPMKANPGSSVQQGNISNQGVLYSNYPSPLQPNFITEDVQVCMNRSEYNSQTSSLQVGQASPLNKTVGVVPQSVVQQNSPLHTKNVQDISSTSHAGLVPHQKLSARPLRAPVPPHNAPDAIASTSVRQGAATGVAGHCQTPAAPSPVSSVAQRASPYSSPYTVGGGESSSASQLPAPLMTSDVPKAWTSTSDNQSLSLSLEEDEALGPKATKAAVLYANIHHPKLKTDVACKSDFFYPFYLSC